MAKAKKAQKVIVLVTGWCPPTLVNTLAAWEFINQTFDQIQKDYPANKYILVAGLKYVGVMIPAYRLAANLGWYLVGVACDKAGNFRHYPVHEKHIIGKKWGDESEFFTQYAIKSGYPFVMVNVAGGKQAARETQIIRDAGGRVYELPLERTRMKFDWDNVKAILAKITCYASFKLYHPQAVMQQDGFHCIHCGEFLAASDFQSDLYGAAQS